MSETNTGAKVARRRTKPWERDPVAWKWSAWLAGAGATMLFVMQFGSMLFGTYTWEGELLTTTYSVLCCTPAIMSLRAKRRYFWYGLLPFAMLLPCVVIVQCISIVKFEATFSRFFPGGAPPLTERAEQFFSQICLSATVVWLATSGPISLIRYANDCSNRRIARRAAEEEATMATLAGAWPPKPGQDTQPSEPKFD